MKGFAREKAEQSSLGGVGRDHLAQLELVRRGCHREIELLQNVFCFRYQLCLARLDELVYTPIAGGVNAARDGEDFAVLVQGATGGNQSAAVEVALDDQHPEAKAAENPVPSGKELAAGLGAEGVVAEDCAAFAYFLSQPSMLRRVDDVEATSLDGNRASACRQSSAVSDG